MRRQTAPAFGAGWAPLAASGRRQSRDVYLGGIGRWLWPAAALGSFAALLAYVLGTDPGPGIGNRSLVTLALAVVVLIVLTVRHRLGPLAVLGTLAEYATVALLAVLLVTAAAPPPVDVERPARAERTAPAEQARGDQDQNPAASLPPVIRHAVGAWSWLASLWEQADRQASRRESNSTPTTRAERPRAAPLPDRTGGNLA